MIKLKLINPDNIYQSIVNGKPFDENLKPYSDSEIESAINQFIIDEEYEKCAVLKRFIDSKIDHESGYKTILQ